ncbi:MAG: polysaccharide biosynthesis/export family protein [Terracidiphilus sp.]|jgi:polysaccharide export outer membrane protein
MSNLSGAMSVGSLTDAPIFPGETVHILVFDAPDFSIVGQVSDGGDIAVPMAGPVHVAGLNSQTAEQAIAERLKSLDLVTSPKVTVTVDTQAMGITVLGGVNLPGIYQPSGKPLLSDLLAMAGGMTTTTGRVIEISNVGSPDKKTDLPWDPTMHNTSNYDMPVQPGDRVIIRPCGIAYVGGNVGKPGAYPLCGSQTTTLAELVDLAGGVLRFNSDSRTYIIRTRPDGSRFVIQVNINHVQKAKSADLAIQEDDIVYVTPSTLKLVLTQALSWAVSVSGPIIYSYH